ncbi:hypothetical protein IMZ48_16045, partial [Candidatus Bathyarchaeota archaeon]|nr:hypothetical protein [Candidatus Bathyarchaeota archaeon]
APGVPERSIHLAALSSHVPLSNLAMALSVLPRDRLVFLSHSFAICVAPLR